MPSKTKAASEPQQAPRRILRQRALCDFTGLSKSTIRTLEQTAAFPGRLQLGPRAIGWYEDEVTAWLATRRRKGA